MAEDISLPDEKSSRDSKSFVGEERKKTQKEKELLKRQSSFEYNQVRGREEHQKQEKKERTKDKILKIVFAVLVLALLVALYFFLIA